jgi:5-methylcytosine-specific restriction endonuclease McrA
VRHDLSKLTDMQLLARTRTLRKTEHESMTDILQDLIETEARKLDLDLGYSSLFDYCVNCLEYSESAAGRRIQAARCIRRYPVVLEMLERNELKLTTISQIESILTDDNYKAILDQVRGASYREVEKIACEYRPPIKFRDRMQHVRVAVKAAKGGDSAPIGAHVEKRVLVQLLASEEQIAKVEKVKKLLSARDPNMPLADVMEVMADEYLARHSPEARHERREERKRAKSPDSRRRELKKTQKTRHIPDAVRDEVHVRDDRQCAYLSPGGKRCECRTGLQVDHMKPYAAGGDSAPGNLRLLCAAHNRRAAEKTMSPNVMAGYWRHL